MAWIETIGPDKASGKLRDIYDSLGGPGKNVDNILAIHSLRPHTLSGHLALYKSVLHHTGNHLPVWFLESVGVLVSLMNGCSYCAAHHAEGLRRQLKNDDRSDEILEALQSGKIKDVFHPREIAALRYAAFLTNDPSSITVGHIDAMREAGLSDGEILEVNQVTAYFAYANRTANGLGVTVDGDDLGLSPPETDDLSTWEHR
jgi:uncharacterized peroxidase-related enzyme